MSVFLAFDGSVNAHWISRYAIRLARDSGCAQLAAVYIEDRETAADELNSAVQELERECERHGLGLTWTQQPLQRSVTESLCAAVPPGPDSFLVCGTRVRERIGLRERRRGLLAGTVAEDLLRRRHCQTLAMRVVQPGLLGTASRLLVPLAGHPRGPSSAMPFLELLAPGLSELHLLLIREVRRWRYRHLSNAAAQRLSLPGSAWLQQIERQLDEQTWFRDIRRDAHVVVSDDVPKQIAITANRLHAQLAILGASERTLRQRLLYGNPLEQILRDTPCDVAIYAAADPQFPARNVSSRSEHEAAAGHKEMASPYRGVR